MTRIPLRRNAVALICCVAVVALAAACGGSSSSSTSTAGGGGGGSSTPATSTPSTSSGGGGLSDSAFCDLAKKWAQKEKSQITSLTSGQSSADNLRSLYTNLANVYGQFVAAAPSDIKPDVQVLYGVFQKLNTILAQSNYDIVKAESKLVANEGLLSSAKVKTAIAHLDAWAKANSCHIKSTS